MGYPARILVVDDDKGIRDSFAAILRDEGYIVDIAESGREAIEKSEVSWYNLALIDIRLPDMEGIELLTKLKNTVPKIRKIIVTGHPSIKNAIDAVNKKADAYILKPVDVEKFLNTVKEQLKLQKNEKKYGEQKVAEFIETRVKALETVG